MKRLLLLLCILLASQAARSQTPTYVPAGDRNYWGLELGVQYNWLGGADNFAIQYVYPYNSNLTNDRVTYGLGFANPGDGIGFSFGGTFDVNLVQNWNLMAKLHYSIHSLTSKEQFSAVCDTLGGVGGNPGLAEYENTIEQSFGFIGGDILIRYQFEPETWYGFAGLGFMGMTSNSIFLAQAILSSDNNCEYPEYQGNDIMQFPPTPVTTLAIEEQEANTLYKTFYIGPKLGVGTFIPIGDDGWMLTPELMLSVPLSDLYNDTYTPPHNPDLFGGEEVASFTNDGVTPPKLWYAQLSIGLKFPWGGNAKPNEGKPVDNVMHQTDEINFKGTVKDRKTNEPVDDVEITVIDLATNEVVKTETTGSNGNYDVLLETPGRYSITAEKDGYLFSTGYIELDEYGRLVKGGRDIYLDKSQNKVRLLVFFETEKAELSKSSLPELQRVAKFLKANPNYQVEIAGHTDNTGDDAYNMELSGKRANSVVDYLVRNGVDRSRLTAKGYGETKPDSTNDTEEGRSENRRVEFVITNK